MAKASPQRFALFGGSFDPVHRGHCALVRQAVKTLKLNRVYVIPARQNPLKTKGPGASGRDRLRMLRLAFKSLPTVTVSDWELKQNRPSYTWHTLKRLKARHPQGVWFVLLGSDQLRGLRRWYRAAKLVKAASFVFFERPGEMKRAVRVPGAVRLPMKPWPISSTELRRLVRKRLPAVRRWMDPAVLRYINKNALYAR